jgi:tetratricopeptide (TPR) repeat protein
MRMLLLTLALALAATGTAGAQAPPATAAASESVRAKAYFEFLNARRLEEQGDEAGALEALKRAQALDPKSAEILAEMAGLYARQNKAQEALDTAERALTIDPKNVDANRMLGLLLAAWAEGGIPPPAGRSPEQLRTAAVDHLTRISDTPAAATDLNLQLTLARLHMRAGNAKAAIPILENIVAQSPYAAEPYSLLADARMALGRVDAAVEALEMAAELNPRHYVRLGEIYEKQERWMEAAAAFEAAVTNIRGAGRDLRLRWYTALLNLPDGTGAARARDELTKFLSTAPNDARAMFLLASAHLQASEYGAAETTARKLLALDPTSVPALRALAAALSGKREYRAIVDLLTPFAKDVANRGRGRESDAALLLAQLAQAQTELGQHAQAIATLTAAVTSDPLSAPALNSLGYTLADRGERLTEAISFIQRALKVEPGNPSYLDSLGWAFFKQGNAVEAETHLRKAADASPRQSIIQDHFGDVLAKQGKYREAIGAWERALAGDGEEIDRAAVQKKIRDARDRQQ